jgi:hypothetical protein
VTGGAGEVQQCRLHRGLRVVLLRILAGPDDPAVLVTLHVHLAIVLAPGQGAGSELLNE